jgi:hypothetical protein
MFAHKEPKIIVNENYSKDTACTICGQAVLNRKLCPECAGEVCFNNEKHIVVDGYCEVCNQDIKKQEKYQRWVNSNLPFCDVKIQNI